MAESETHKHVKVIRLCPVPAIVENPKERPWLVFDEAGRQFEWDVVVRPEPDFESALWFFESRQVALAWVKQHEWAEKYNWDALRESQGDGSESSAPVQKRSHDSLTFFRDYGGTGDEYEVPAGGVEDWAAKLPVSAGVPDWMPKSYRSSGKSDISGHEDAESSGSRVMCIVGNHEGGLAFSTVHSASTYY